jgi:hypothetical protein
VSPDQLLFIGDALCASADGRMTDLTLRLFDTLLAHDMRHYVEGHHPAVTARSEFEALAAKARAAERGEATPGDEDSEYFAAAFSTSAR